MARALQPISVWTVFEHPDDFPDDFVARRSEVIEGEMRATDQVVVASTLATLRRHLERFYGPMRATSRIEHDDANVVETLM
jgi:hypothetical protein